MKETATFFLLQDEDGDYYTEGRIDGWPTVEWHSDPLNAVRFDSADSAKSFHDQSGHFYHAPMRVVRFVMVLDDSATIECPALERSTLSDDRD